MKIAAEIGRLAAEAMALSILAYYHLPLAACMAVILLITLAARWRVEVLDAWYLLVYGLGIRE